MKYLQRSIRQESTILLDKIELILLFSEESICTILDDYRKYPEKLAYSVASFFRRNPKFKFFRSSDDNFSIRFDRDNFFITLPDSAEHSFKIDNSLEYSPYLPIDGIYSRLDALNWCGILYSLDNHLDETLDQLSIYLNGNSTVEFRDFVSIECCNMSYRLWIKNNLWREYVR